MLLTNGFRKLCPVILPVQSEVGQQRSIAQFLVSVQAHVMAMLQIVGDGWMYVRHQMSSLQVIDHEKALSAFETYELELFFKLKESGKIHGSTIKKVRKTIELSGVSRQFTKQFIHDQIQDMRQQLDEQER
jgi:hypothetical protein